MKFLIFILSVFVLAGCSSAPKFEMANNSSGYTVKEVSGKNHLEIDLILPSNTAEKELAYYGQRAVGEECLKSGYGYFDTGETTPFKIKGFCFSKDEYGSLGIVFEKKGLNEEPKKFVIESIFNKSSTLVKVGDEVLKVDGKNLTSISQIKELIFIASQKQNTLPLELIREGKKITINEPIATTTGALGRPEDLDRLRKLIR